ncbi:unnamed protein product [Lepeophtheirus salmonis]|uniref:(salmon louse) hypothetical protein n=1 Tax=Lepeophtheirus salmonis TaxID=72036 RepID=A0A7R8D437_LEPSM|nr:unnamed protein product [Lepeophtheirus salmonis]CAF3020464.1 unnamed protein product [Lepeophtheirus salmonis]
MPKLYQPNAPQKTNSPASNKPPPAKKTVAVAPNPVPSTPPSTPILGTTKEQQLQQLEILKKMELQKALELKEQIELHKKQIEIERSIESQKRNLEEQLELKRQFEMQRLQFELQKESEMHAQLEIREQQLEIQRQIEIIKHNELKRQAEIQRQIQLQECVKAYPEKLASKFELNSKFNYIEGSSSSSSCNSTESASPMKEYVSETKTYSCSYPATPTPDHINQTGLNNPYPSLERRLQQKLVNNELLTVQVGGVGNGHLSNSPKPNEDLERMVTELASPLPPLEPLPSCLNPPKSNGYLV